MHKGIICIVARSGDSIALEIAMMVTKKFLHSSSVSLWGFD